MEKWSEKVIATAKPGSGVGKAGQDLAEQLAKLDQHQVVDAIVPLLAHEGVGVPYLASYIILECRDGLEPRHLDALIKGYRNGGSWLPSAIASIGTEKAAEFLVEQFRENPQIHGQVDWALAELGEKVIPALMKVFEATEPAGRGPRVPADLFGPFDFHSSFRHVLKEMDGRGAPALPRLMEIAADKETDPAMRREAALTVGYVGVPAEPHFPKLRALAEAEPEVFGETVTRTIIASGTASTAEALADRVDAGGEEIWYTIREIALLRERAKPVAPRVASWLAHPKWEARVMAARTLGAIGSIRHREKLESLLGSRTDWRLAYVAAKSLAELSRPEAIPALQAASNDHWFPIVRDAAANAIKVIRGAEKLASSGATKAGDLSDYIFVDRRHLTIDRKDIDGLGKPKAGVGEGESFLTFQTRAPQLAKCYVEARNRGGGDQVRFFGHVYTERVPGGMIVGAAAGEWIGGLQLVPPKGESVILLRKNVLGMLRWQGEVLVASGTDHMGMNEGMIHSVSKVDDGWRTNPWFVLPGRPMKLWVTEKGELVAECDGGTVVFKEPEKFRYHGAQPVAD